MISTILPTYARADLEFVKGKGAWLTEADGSHFLDLASGIAVNSLGHAHPDLENHKISSRKTLARIKPI